ncbi:MAG: L,D-transpeptidase, partial [Flavobacteriaceae bacterium]
MLKRLLYLCVLFVFALFLSCRVKQETIMNPLESTTEYNADSIVVESPALAKIASPNYVAITRNITIGEYFGYMDSLVKQYDASVPYLLSEHLLVRANPWIIDTLSNTDYYRMIERDSFVYDQKKLIVLRKTDSLVIPDSTAITQLLRSLKRTWIDVNIPEFKLRIYEDSTLLFTFPIRVGQNKKKYLAMGDRITDLRTKSGLGEVVRIERNPKFYNPVNGKQFFATKRDDQRTTLMPQIPWIETEINGVRNGQMIHPTTNPETLEKAYSNGCIG